MKSRFIFLTPRRAQCIAVGLVAVLSASCASQATQPPVALTAAPLETQAVIPATLAPQATLVPTQIVDVQAVATSRGPNLQATDPATVSLAAGQLQLVEFFRFT